MSYWQARKRKGFDDDRRIRHGGDALARGTRILLVDDERELADMVATILHGAGFASVDIANSSAEALSSIAARSASPEHAYQLFVLDVMMPGMDGFELLGRIRQLPAHTSTPALFLTAKTVRIVPDGGQRLHREAVLLKSWCCASPPCCAAAMPPRTRCWSWLRAA